MADNRSGTQPQSKYLFLMTAGITVLVTFALMIGSMSSGGFVSGGSMAASGSEGFVGWPIAIHLASALPALLLGPVILFMRKGDRTHKALGRIWAGLMLITAISSAFIQAPGAGIAGTGFSFIHLFTVWTLIALPIAIFAIRTGNVTVHRQAMTGLYIGLCIAGAFTLVPGRLLGNFVFGS